MISVRLNDILSEKDRNLHWLSKKTEIAYSTLLKLSNNQTTSISFNTLEKICLVLEIEPGDLVKLHKE